MHNKRWWITHINNHEKMFDFRVGTKLPQQRIQLKKLTSARRVYRAASYVPTLCSSNGVWPVSINILLENTQRKVSTSISYGAYMGQQEIVVNYLKKNLSSLRWGSNVVAPKVLLLSHFYHIFVLKNMYITKFKQQFVR